MHVGQRVKLIRKLSGYDKGAEGVVAHVTKNEVTVDIDRDADGTKVEPPDPMPPVEGDKYFTSD